MVGNGLVFDYHGLSEWPRYWAHAVRRAKRWWPGWSADTVSITGQALVSRVHAREYHGLWMEERHEYLFEPLPRARCAPWTGFLRR